MRSSLSCDYLYFKTWLVSHILRQNHKVHNIDFTLVYIHTHRVRDGDYQTLLVLLFPANLFNPLPILLKE